MPLEPSELFPEVSNIFEFPSVHAEMIYDGQRVEAYQRAISETVEAGDVVVDVGTGTGLLAFLCLQAGASRVHAIDRAAVIRHAKNLAQANGCSDRIVFHHIDARDLELDEKVDVIVSEIIGHVAFEEGMVETLFDARMRFSKPGGKLIPRTITLFGAPVYEPDLYSSCIDCWEPAYGIDFSYMRSEALKTGYLVDIAVAGLLARPLAFFKVDFFNQVHPGVTSERLFTVHRGGQVNGLVLWFDSLLSDSVHLSSDPWSKTHWKQCFMPLPRPISVSRLDKLSITIDLKFRNHPDDDKFAISMNMREVTHDAS
jgi:protein arginine N-methyltransferase 1